MHAQTHAPTRATLHADAECAAHGRLRTAAACKTHRRGPVSLPTRTAPRSPSTALGSRRPWARQSVQSTAVTLSDSSGFANSPRSPRWRAARCDTLGSAAPESCPLKPGREQHSGGPTRVRCSGQARSGAHPPQKVAVQAACKCAVLERHAHRCVVAQLQVHARWSMGAPARQHTLARAHGTRTPVHARTPVCMQSGSGGRSHLRTLSNRPHILPAQHTLAAHAQCAGSACASVHGMRARGAYRAVLPGASSEWRRVPVGNAHMTVSSIATTASKRTKRCARTHACAHAEAIAWHDHLLKRRSIGPTRRFTRRGRWHHLRHR
jgi:hypothetical protein